LETKKYKVRWIDIDNTNSNKDDLRYNGQRLGGAIFARGEGVFLSDNMLFFTATTGGKNKTGQIWKYAPNKNNTGGNIELFYESNDSNVLNLPDNIILSPNGNILLCEDGKGRDRLVCIKPDKTILYLANNAYNRQEFAGICFAPNNKILFINIYNPTMTIAIKGPWNEL